LQSDLGNIIEDQILDHYNHATRYDFERRVHSTITSFRIKIAPSTC